MKQQCNALAIVPSLLCLLLMHAQSHAADKKVSDTISRIAVFCSADDKVCEQYKTCAYKLGALLGSYNFSLITGGSCTGLMQSVTDGYATTTETYETLYGVMPLVLAPYNVHHPLIPKNNIVWTETIHTRLAQFHTLADAIIVLPGGFGTLHELMDFLVHKQFGMSNIPIILINSDNFWDGLHAQFETMHAHRLLSSRHMQALSIVSSEAECIDLLLNYATQNTASLDTHYWEK